MEVSHSALRTFQKGLHPLGSKYTDTSRASGAGKQAKWSRERERQTQVWRHGMSGQYGAGDWFGETVSVVRRR
jgi:hypothetical protein